MSDVKPEAVKSEKTEDHVVAELDVFLSQDLAQNLYLLQYPLRPPWRPYDTSQMASAKMKPKQQRVQMEYAIDAKGPHYDPDSAIKTNAQVLNSTCIESRTTYAVAALRGNELHLTPIHGGILAFRPSFAHLDAADAEKKKAEEEDIAPVHEEEDDEDVPIAKPLTVQFKRRENERTALAKKQSHAFLKQVEDEEPWVNLQCHPRDSLDGKRMFERLFCKAEAAVAFDLPADQYVNRLMPAAPASSTATAPGAIVEEGFSLATLRRLPLDMQLKSLFSSAAIEQYQRIRVRMHAKKEALCFVFVQLMWLCSCCRSSALQPALMMSYWERSHMWRCSCEACGSHGATCSTSPSRGLRAHTICCCLRCTRMAASIARPSRRTRV